MFNLPETIAKKAVAIFLAATLCFVTAGCSKYPGGEQPQPTPTPVVTVAPTTAPTADPTAAPTAEPTAVPTAAPTAKPTAVPTAEPTATPAPTAKPTAKPTAAPTETPAPTPTPVPYTIEVANVAGTWQGDIYNCPQAEENLHSFTITAYGDEGEGYVIIKICDREYTTVQLASGESITVNVKAKEGKVIEFTAAEGRSELFEKGETDKLIKDGETIFFTLEGLKISIIGDSISTYTGWSDAYPIAGPEYTYRYGEAYYGPEGGDFHNTELLVTDTWWHQAAERLGAEILMCNSGNSTGILSAKYAANADWEQYLKDLRGFDSRPYYMGRDGKSPDIIAIYLGSADMGASNPFGSVEDIDFDTLIVDNGDGSYTYAEPVTVAEAYCIMLHKMQVTYPGVEIYCFTSVPNSGGKLDTCNTRLKKTVPYNKMVKEVAAYHGLAVVDLMEAFALDPDGDGVAVQEDWDSFKLGFNGDPHPNAHGFDVITEKFLEVVYATSKYN